VVTAVAKCSTELSQGYQLIQQAECERQTKRRSHRTTLNASHCYLGGLALWLVRTSRNKKAVDTRYDNLYQVG
jgi:hypothetical protein